MRDALNRSYRKAYVNNWDHGFLGVSELGGQIGGMKRLFFGYQRERSYSEREREGETEQPVFNILLTMILCNDLPGFIKKSSLNC